MSEPAPLVEFERASIQHGGVSTEPLTAAGGSRQVALVGYFSPFFRLLRAEAQLASGAVRLAGLAVPGALRSGQVALAAFELPLLAWTARRYVIESARLAGFDQRAAERRADAELEASELRDVANLRLSDLAEPLRRRVSLVGAAVTKAPTICAEAPFVDLDESAESVVADLLERLAERRLIVSFPAEPPGGRARASFERSDFTVVVARGVVSYAGPPVSKS